MINVFSKIDFLIKKLIIMLRLYLGRSFSVKCVNADFSAGLDFFRGNFSQRDRLERDLITLKIFFFFLCL